MSIVHLKGIPHIYLLCILWTYFLKVWNKIYLKIIFLLRGHSCWYPNKEILCGHMANVTFKVSSPLIISFDFDFTHVHFNVRINQSMIGSAFCPQSYILLFYISGFAHKYQTICPSIDNPMFKIIPYK